MILKGRMQIGLRQMASVASFGEKTEIGELKLRDQCLLLFGGVFAFVAQPRSIGEGGDEYAGCAEYCDERKMAGAGGGHGGVGSCVTPDYAAISGED